MDLTLKQHKNKRNFHFWISTLVHSGKEKTMEYKEFSQNKQIYYQQKLANYLKNYRVCKGLRSKELGRRLGYSEAKYSSLESDKKPYQKFINVLQYIYSLADLEGMSISEFILMIEGCPKKNKYFQCFENEKLERLISVLAQKSEAEIEALLLILDK